tara:strand:- start:2189 stop:2353 length:165 start_codon:yes stop_codon:yes gene_type:complete
MEYKKCAKCKEKKQLDKFYNKVGSKQSYCSPCMKAYTKKRHQQYLKRKGNAWWI